MSIHSGVKAIPLQMGMELYDWLGWSHFPFTWISVFVFSVMYVLILHRCTEVSGEALIVKAPSY